MYIIKLNAIDSTNNYLKALASVAAPRDFTVVIADSQTDGKGQMGASWQSDSGKNLMVSVFKRLDKFSIEHQYFLSIVVALSIYKSLQSFNIPKLHIKWPNDILSENKKICGILIENVIKHNMIQGAIIGFGLNVNQTQFINLPKASSLHLISGKLFNKDQLLTAILKNFQLYFKLLETKSYSQLKTEYESKLFRINKPSTFKGNDGVIFTGIIKGITSAGKLKVWTEDETIKTYELKELTLMY